MLQRSICANVLFIFSILFADKTLSPQIQPIQRPETLEKNNRKSASTIEPTEKKKMKELNYRVDEICNPKDKVLRGVIDCLTYSGNAKMVVRQRSHYFLCAISKIQSILILAMS